MSSSMIWSICLCSLSKIQFSSAISLPPQDARGSEAGCRGSSAGIGGEGEKCEGGEKRSTIRHVDLVSMPHFSPTANEDAVDRDLVPAGAEPRATGRSRGPRILGGAPSRPPCAEAGTCGAAGRRRRPCWAARPRCAQAGRARSGCLGSEWVGGGSGGDGEQRWRQTGR